MPSQEVSSFDFVSCAQVDAALHFFWMPLG